jgi:hypothetical protein
MAAYAVALSVVEALYSLFAVRRAKDGSGSDIIVAADPGDQLLESAFRLEVSGTMGSAYDVRDRFKMKCDQILSGNSDLDGIVCVVGFEARLVFVERIMINV